MGEMRIAYRLLVGKPEGRRPLARPGRRWVDNIRIDLVSSQKQCTLYVRPASNTPSDSGTY
jgi:hypothetical protein